MILTAPLIRWVSWPTSITDCPTPDGALVHHANRRTAAARRFPASMVRLPVELRRQFLDALYAGQSFMATVRDLALTPNQV